VVGDFHCPCAGGVWADVKKPLILTVCVAGGCWWLFCLGVLLGPEVVALGCVSLHCVGLVPDNSTGVGFAVGRAFVGSFAWVFRVALDVPWGGWAANPLVGWVGLAGACLGWCGGVGLAWVTWSCLGIPCFCLFCCADCGTLLFWAVIAGWFFAMVSLFFCVVFGVWVILAGLGVCCLAAVFGRVGGRSVGGKKKKKKKRVGQKKKIPCLFVGCRV